MFHPTKVLHVLKVFNVIWHFKQAVIVPTKVILFSHSSLPWLNTQTFTNVFSQCITVLYNLYSHHTTKDDVTCIERGSTPIMVQQTTVQ